MGSDPTQDELASLPEQPQHVVELPEYQIGRSPVTVAQFALFVKASGYRTTAERVGFSNVWEGQPPEDCRPDNDVYWHRVPAASWWRPRGPDSHVRNKADHPVTHISLEDAQAFCTWSGTRLPNEAEWEKAARGEDGRVYAQGNALPEDDAFNCAMRLGDTSPIGVYPAAASPYGLVDMLGNVWEWTCSPFCAYPFKINASLVSWEPDFAERILDELSNTFGARDVVAELKETGRLPEEFADLLKAADLRAIRGGSFYNNCLPASHARCPLRIYAFGHYHCFDLGFRVTAK